MAKTLSEKLASARALVAKYENAVNAETIAKDIQKGDNVTVKFGRGEKVRQIVGTVIGVKDDDKGNRSVAVIDADLNVVKVPVRDVQTNASADERRTPVGEAAAQHPSDGGDDVSRDEQATYPTALGEADLEDGGVAADAQVDPLSVA